MFMLWPFNSAKKTNNGLTHLQGLRAERFALLFLRLKGYRLLARRLKTPVGEIDLLMLHKNTLVVIEVKYRPSFDVAAGAISRHQQNRLLNATQYYLAQHQYHIDKTIRFDAIFVAPGKWPRHIKNAWQQIPY